MATVKFFRHHLATIVARDNGAVGHLIVLPRGPLHLFYDRHVRRTALHDDRPTTCLVPKRGLGKPGRFAVENLYKVFTHLVLHEGKNDYPAKQSFFHELRARNFFLGPQNTERVVSDEFPYVYRISLEKLAPASVKKVCKVLNAHSPLFFQSTILPESVRREVRLALDWLRRSMARHEGSENVRVIGWIVSHVGVRRLGRP